MKKAFTLFAAVVLLAVNLSAQLKVITNGNVGIGTDTPAEKLHVNGAIRGNESAGSLNIKTDYNYTKIGALNTSFSHFLTNSGNFYFDKGIDIRNGKLTSYTGENLYLCTSSNFDPRLTISSSTGNVGIGLAPITGARLNVGGNIAVNGSIVLTSDIRLKENVKQFHGGVTRLALLNPITFNYKSDAFKMAPTDVVADTMVVDKEKIEADKNFNSKTRYGFSAQEVQEIFPDLVTEDENGYLSVDYIGLIPVLVDALKEQQAEIVALKRQVAALLKNEETKPQ